MSNSLKNRTFADSLRTGLYKSIIAARKASKHAVKLSKDAKSAATTTYKDVKSTSKQAWNANI